LTRRNNLCKKSRTHSGFKSAKFICLKTCNICQGASKNDPTEDSTTEKFFLRTRVVGTQTVNIVKPCQWLQKKNAAKICENAKSKPGIRSVVEVCPRTCALATGAGRM
jgi:hypothetical protein